MNKLLCVYVCVCLQFRVQIQKPEVVIDFVFHATICVDLDLCTPFLEGGINLSFNELVEAVHGEICRIVNFHKRLWVTWWQNGAEIPVFFLEHF